MTGLTGRSLAYRILRRFDPMRSFIAESLAKELHKTHEPQRCTDLVCGTLRHRHALDRVIVALGGRPIKRISTHLISVIRVGTYELCFCVQTPPYSVVNEAVEFVKGRAGSKQVAFVNAVLRQIGRGIKHRSIGLDQANEAATLMTGPTQGCEFQQAVFPDPRQDQSAYLAGCFSLPEWLIRSWLAEFGYETTRTICLASNRRPGVYLRTNTVRTSDAGLMQALKGHDKSPMLVEAGLIGVAGSGNIAQLPGFNDGCFSVQDRTAYRVAKRLNPKGSERILDYCAAPGGKTTHLAELTLDQACICATDSDGKRLQRVAQNVRRLGLKSVQTIEFNGVMEYVRTHGPFDAVLADVPCSNTGVLAKRLEVRYRITPKDIGQLQTIQQGILVKVADLVRPQGRPCYSTCSIQPEENSHCVKTFLARDTRFTLEQESLILPSAHSPDCDGGYYAMLVRTE